MSAADKFSLIYSKVSQLINKEADTIRLLFAGKVVENTTEKMVDHYKMPDNAILLIIFR